MTSLSSAQFSILSAVVARASAKMLCTCLTVLGGLAAVVYLILVWNFNYWKKAGINGPKPKILAGNLPNMWTQKQHIFYDLKKIYEYVKDWRFYMFIKLTRGFVPYDSDFKNEPVVGYFSVRTPQLMIRDPELIKEVLTKSFRFFASNQFSDLVDEKSDPLFSRNPFSLSGEKWKTRRAEITPAFTNNRVCGREFCIEL